MASYPYHPLELPHETRILIVHPAELFNDSLICSLAHIHIESEEPYSALSYCWSKSIAHPLPLDTQINLTPSKNSQDEKPRHAVVGDLLDDPDRDYLFIKFGGALPDGQIICDGVKFTVGGELNRALRHMREETDPIRIWVDAICINQSDMKERAEHVKIMGQIYKNASEVKIWLGEGIGLEPLVFEAFDDIQAIFNDLRHDLQNVESAVEAQRLLMTHKKWLGVRWDALAHFLDRAWFERIWCVQEVANAKNAMLRSGKFQIPWEAFAYILESLGTFRMNDHIPNIAANERIMGVIHLRESVLAGKTISQDRFPSILERLRSFQSTVPSDKIYGMMGILDAGVAIKVDYTQSAEQLFTDVAMRYLQGGYPEILYHCGEPDQPTSLNLPSWVPDWTRARWTKSFHSRQLVCNAAGDTEVQMVVDAAAGTLRFKGRLLDTVRVVDDVIEIPRTEFDPYDHSVYSLETDPTSMSKARRRKENRNLRDSFDNMVRLAWPTKYDFSWQKYENLWRTFICNRLPDDSVPLTDTGMADQGLAWENFMDWIFERGSIDDEEAINKQPYYKEVVPLNNYAVWKRILYLYTRKQANANTFGKAYTTWCYNRRFFISESERYGWAVDGTQPGDRVAIFNGLRYPFLLRYAGDNRYKIIGDCYIHGLMEGEALGSEFVEADLLIS
ncbi:hypothetical protein EJ04DRAFT_473998 [Polyplosphaeria fusca]|uniref:Heterokaryon incompatibility domain-containing protein n=1 Tax=Polyplosphaeria fusca TaxID=682080 RepID=A0A9P4QST0_9PLEO|nr:hypothetical protein EJ04DRAFT_473998 [Polyplosphaeria fusca]